MKRLLLMTTVLSVLAVPVVGFALDVHVNGKSVTCTKSADGKSVTCSGTLTGLGGTETATAEVIAGYRCTTSSGSNDPLGTNKNFVTGQSGPLSVDKNGNTYFSVTTGGTGCPDKQTNFDPFATIHVYDSSGNDVNGSPFTVPIT